MVHKGILESISSSEWATPVVPVVKRDGSIRLCGDYRCTVNKSVKPYTYPLPTVNEVLSTVAGGKVFSKLDLSQAYLQLPVDDATSRLLTLNTHKGLFRVKRLPFGVSIAVAIFQKKTEEVFAGVDGVLPYLDDIYITGTDMTSHNLKLEEVLQRLDQAGLRLKREKCCFALPEIVLLGFRVNARGIQPTVDKVKAIHEAPSPTNVVELQAFLGLLNFYGSFLKRRSDILEPLHKLLQKDVPWEWTAEHEEAYKASKGLLTTDDLLVHYDEKLPLILTSDASSYGLGSVLSHLLPNGKEAPVAYYSRTMTKTERNYSQTDKEALAILAGVKKFHSYLLGRRFRIVTDHRPLLGIFNSTKPIPQMISPRVLRWSLSLQAYDYELEYRKGKDIANADALSRLPMSGSSLILREDMS
ncbi:hypothetical protein JTE90_010485 [Oedothorax gibbosus]|uniref:Reverse transcriptase domain-containing protein n=1 Tax=Oedothorax gibbosus TaxID=931172 RepID=A0AAV6VZM4_9ARAC|nr:hypothetical protein JTE90_010485 [Oedothorax gibbosus]